MARSAPDAPEGQMPLAFEDFDDFQPRTWVNGGGGCDTTGGRAPLLALALAALATRRRAASPTARR